MSTLAEFLLARIAEDEAAARAVIAWSEAPANRGLPWLTTPGDGRIIAWGLTCVGVATVPLLATHIARHDPARVLVECEAKRALVLELQRMQDEEMGWDGVEDKVMTHLALPYAAHPDYRDEWKP